MPYIVKSSLDIGGKIVPWNEKETQKLIKDKEKFLKENEKVVEIEEKYLLETIGYEMLANELHNKYAHFYVAKKADEVIGYIGGWIIDTTCDMINFVVKEEYQRIGVGTKLFKTLENIL